MNITRNQSNEIKSCKSYMEHRLQDTYRTILVRSSNIHIPKDSFMDKQSK